MTGLLPQLPTLVPPTLGQFTSSMTATLDAVAQFAASVTAADATLGPGIRDAVRIDAGRNRTPYRAPAHLLVVDEPGPRSLADLDDAEHEAQPPLELLAATVSRTGPPASAVHRGRAA